MAENAKRVEEQPLTTRDRVRSALKGYYESEAEKSRASAEDYTTRSELQKVSNLDTLKKMATEEQDRYAKYSERQGRVDEVLDGLPDGVVNLFAPRSDLFLNDEQKQTAQEVYRKEVGQIFDRLFEESLRFIPSEEGSLIRVAREGNSVPELLVDNALARPNSCNLVKERKYVNQLVEVRHPVDGTQKVREEHELITGLVIKTQPEVVPTTNSVSD